MQSENAKIASVRLCKQRGMLTLWMDLKYDGSGQGYGGYRLDGWDKTGNVLNDLLDTFKVQNFRDLEGEYCRVKREDGEFHLSGKVKAIGHPVKDRWFSFDNY